MNCAKCGAQIGEQAKFCPGCGEGVNPAQPTVSADQGIHPGIQGPEGEVPPGYRAAGYEIEIQEGRKNNKRSVIIAAIAAIMVVGVAGVVFGIRTFGGSNGFQRVLEKTEAHYRQELQTVKEQNPVIGRMAALENVSAELTLMMDGEEVAVTVNCDKEQKLLQAFLPLDSFGIKQTAELVLSEDRGVLGLKDVFYVESAYDELVDQLRGLSAVNDLGLTDEDLDILEESIDAILAQRDRLVLGEESDDPRLAESVELMESLVDAMPYEKTATTVKIGDAEVNADSHDFLVTQEGLNGWISEKLIPWAEQSEQVDDWIEMLQQMNMLYAESGMDMDLDIGSREELVEALKTLQEEIPADLTLKISYVAYEDVIVGFREELNTGERLSVLFNGGDYRLNRIEMEIALDEEEANQFEVCFEGNHVGAASFDTAITVKDGVNNHAASINWDTSKTEDNLVISADGEEDQVMTFALVDNEIVFSVVDSWGDGLTVVADSLAEAIVMPENTTPLAELDLNGLMQFFVSEEDIAAIGGIGEEAEQAAA